MLISEWFQSVAGSKPEIFGPLLSRWRIQLSSFHYGIRRAADGPGQPPLPTRLMAGLAILKHTFNLSDEELVARWVENPYFQHFCGEDVNRRVAAQQSTAHHPSTSQGGSVAALPAPSRLRTKCRMT